MKRMILLMLVLALCLSVLSGTVLAANPFTDVPAAQWYYDDVINAYEMGLINGKTGTTFKPDDNLTYAEAVKLAACMNQRYSTGSVSLKNGSPWYQTYVDYCKTKNIIDVNYAWDQPATRAGYMEIFAGALPDSALLAINEVSDGAIPDVPMTHNQSAAIYKLYRAGIVQGSDAAHNCNPGATIKRSEVAAILTRMMDSSQRIRFSLKTEETKEEEKTEPLRIVTQPAPATAPEGEKVALHVEAEGGKTPYRFDWYSLSNGVRESIVGIPGVEVYGDSISSRAEIVVGGPYDWTTNEPFFCVITDAEGQSVVTNAVMISVKLPPQELTIDYQSGDKLLSSYSPSFIVTFSGGEGPYVVIWEMKDGDNWVNMAGMENVKLYQNGLELVCQFEGYVWDNCTFRCVIFDSLGSSVKSKDFHVFLN